MRTRCIIRSLLLSSATLALVVWPSISNAATIANPDVLSWNSSGTGTLFLSTTQYPTQAAWNAGAAAAGVSPGAFSPSGLTFQSGFNVTNNDLIIQADNGTDALAAYNFLYQATKAGYNFANWSGNSNPGGTPGPAGGVGIYSDASQTGNPTGNSAATDPQFITGIGIALNDLNTDDVFENDTGYSNWDGIAVGPNSVLVKFTYYGDTQLRGVVDQSDVNSAVIGRDSGLPGWVNGESEFSGITHQADVNDVVIGRDSYASDPVVFPSDPVVGDALLGGNAFAAGSNAVPEPSAGVLALLGLIGLIAGFSSMRSRGAIADRLNSRAVRV